MATRNSGEAAAHSADQQYYDLSSGSKDSTNDYAIQPEPHGPNHAQYKPTVEKSGSKTEDVTVDVEKGGMSPVQTQSDSREESEEPKTKTSAFYRKYRPYIHSTIWLIMTGWWIAGLILHRPGTAQPKNWIIPFLLWLAITIRIVTLYIPISIVYKPLRFTWKNTVSRGINMIPEKLRIPLGALGTIGVILLGTFVTEESRDNTRGNRAISLLGLAVCILALWATSRNRKAVNCKHHQDSYYRREIIVQLLMRRQKGTQLSWAW